MTIPKLINEIIKVTGKKQVEIADEVGVKPSTLSRYKWGDVTPSKEVLDKLNAIFCRSVCNKRKCACPLHQ